MEDNQTNRVSRMRAIRAARPNESFHQVLVECGPESHTSVVELACIDLIDRLRAGNTACVEDYLKAAPEIQSNEDVLDLIDAEICARQELDLPLDPDSFAKRFPNLAAQIERILVLDGIEAELQPTRPSRKDLPQVPGYRLNRAFMKQESSTIYSAQSNDNVPCLLRLFETRSRDNRRLVRAVHSSCTASHPTLLPVRKHSAVGDRLYYTTDFVDGLPLSNPESKPPDSAQLGEWLKSLAMALAFVETTGMSVGKIRAEHVLIDHRNHPRIVGFGCLPAEDATGHVRHFGELMHELLTGDVLEKPNSQPELNDGNIDPALRQICVNCLGLNPASEYREISDVADALTANSNGRTAKPEVRSRSFLSRLLRRRID